MQSVEQTLRDVREYTATLRYSLARESLARQESPLTLLCDSLMLGTDKLRMKLVSLVIVISISASDAQDTSLVAQLKALQALALGKNQGVSES